ncbi:MAG: DUF294 nucleotidyltransferase-like domain-containing protein [Myxococcota bacterium]
MANQTRTLIDIVVSELGSIPPFDRLELGDLERLADTAEIRHLPRGTVVFEEGDRPESQFFVVKSGRIEVERRLDGERVPVDVCDEGDIFGIRALLVSQSYSASARASEESLVYVLSYPAFAEMMERSPMISMYFAAGFAAELPPLRERLVEASQEVRKAWAGRHTGLEGLHVLKPKRDLITCPAEASVQDVARRMAEERIGSMVIVDDDLRAIGIVTDTDLRNKVVALDRRASEVRVDEVMSSPVRTIPANPTVEDVTERIVREGTRHFVMTEDGSPDTRALGLVSEHDVLLTKRSVPSVILDSVRHAKSAADLRAARDLGEDLLIQYLREEVSMKLVAAVISKFNDALVERALEWALAELEDRGQRPPVRFCWLGLGSDGREEQLLRTDQDNAILFEDPSDEASVGAVQNFFLDLGHRVVESLVEAGFALCPGKIMANNPKWVQPLAGWKTHFEGWITTPEPMALMHANIFFDFRTVHGPKDLSDQLMRWLLIRTHEERSFFPFFARSAQANPPPFSFFREMVLEKSGEHKDRFDIKARAMMPLCDSARVLTYAERLSGPSNTPERFRALAKRDLGSLSKLCTEAADAYELFMRVRAEEGLRSRTSGRFIQVKSLSKLERQSLRTAFRIVEDIQLALRQRFQTDYLR